MSAASGEVSALHEVEVRRIEFDPTPLTVTVGDPVPAKAVLSCPVTSLGFRQVEVTFCIGTIPVRQVLTIPVIEVTACPPALVHLPVPTQQVSVVEVEKVKKKGCNC
jgi:hypothetical protein